MVAPIALAIFFSARPCRRQGPNSGFLLPADYWKAPARSWIRGTTSPRVIQAWDLLFGRASARGVWLVVGKKKKKKKKKKQKKKLPGRWNHHPEIGGGGERWFGFGVVRR